jgi:DNA-binding response OmpR family regulator
MLLRPPLYLVVEPEPELGLDLASALDATGCFVAGPFPSSTEALRWLGSFTPDAAFIDLPIADDASLELLRELQLRSVPFVGSGANTALDTLIQLRHGTWLARPCLLSDMVTAILALLC